jgi:hypothetical protein
MKRGELVFWVTPRIKIPPYTRSKHWAFIMCFNRSKKRPQAYLVSENCAYWVDIGQLVPATIEQAIRYDRDHYKHSAARTRASIAEAKKRLDW